jgi:hypothetical protein
MNDGCPVDYLGDTRFAGVEQRDGFVYGGGGESVVGVHRVSVLPEFLNARLQVGHGVRP